MQTPYPQAAVHSAPTPEMVPNYYPYYQTVYGGYPAYAAYPQTAVQDQVYGPPAPTSALASWFDYTNPSYIKGVVVATGVTLIVTNPAIQSAVVKGAVAAWSAVTGGLEEIKEKIRDARAEKSMA